MPAPDGSIIINTKLDTSGINKGMGSLGRQAEHAALKLKEMNAAVKEQERVVRSLQVALEKQAVSPKPTADIKAQGKVVADLAAALERANAEYQQLNSLGIKGYNTDAIDAFQAEKVRPAAAALSEATAKLKELKAAAADVAPTAAKLDEATARLAQMKTEASKLGGEYKKLVAEKKRVDAATKKATHTFEASGKRIAMLARRVFLYSVVLKGLHGILDYFKDVSKTSAQLTTAFARLRGALITAFTPIWNAVLPALITFINIVTKAVQAVAMFFSVLTGKSLQNAEALYNEAEAIKNVGAAADDAKKSLAGFDEINNIATNKGAGGNGGSSSTPPIFEDIEPPQWLTDMTLRWKDIFFKWDNLDINDIIDKIVVGLGILSGALIGWQLGGPGGAVLGAIIGAGIGLAITELLPDFTNLSGEDIKGLFAAGLSGILGFTVGFGLGGLPGGVMGFLIGVGISLAFDKLVVSKLPDGEKWKGTIYRTIFNGLLGAGLGVKAGTAAAASAGVTGVAAALGTGIFALLGATVVVGISVIWESVASSQFQAGWKKIKAFFDKDWKEFFSSENLAEKTDFSWVDFAVIAFSPTLGLFFNEVKKIGTEGGIEWLNGWKEYFSTQNLLAILIDLALAPFLPANAAVFSKTGKTLGQLIVEGFSQNLGSANSTAKMKSAGAGISTGALSGAKGQMIEDEREWVDLAGEPSEIFKKENDISGGISRTFESNGKSIMQGLWDGMKAIWGFFAPWWANIIADIAAMEKRISGSGVNASGFGGGGRSFSTVSSVAISNIPALATGTVVPRNKPFAAMLGDNKNETEIVSPLSTMKQALLEALMESGGGDINLTVLLDGDVVHKSVVKRNTQATRRTGRNPLLGV